MIEVVSIKANFPKYHCSLSWCPDCWEQYRKSAPGSRAAIIGFHFVSSPLLQSSRTSNIWLFRHFTDFFCWVIHKGLTAISPRKGFLQFVFQSAEESLRATSCPVKLFIKLTHILKEDGKEMALLPPFLPLFAMLSLPHFEASPDHHWPVW